MTMIDDAFDAVELDMIRHGDMLGPRLGQKVFDALRNPPSREAGEVTGLVERIGEIVHGRHERGFVMWPLVDGARQKEALSKALLPTIKEPTDGK